MTEQALLAPPAPTEPPAAGHRRWRPPRARRVAKHAVLIVTGFVMLYPLLWMLASPVKPNALIFRDPSLIPTELDLSNYPNG